MEKGVPKTYFQTCRCELRIFFAFNVETRKQKQKYARSVREWKGFTVADYICVNTRLDELFLIYDNFKQMDEHLMNLGV